MSGFDNYSLIYEVLLKKFGHQGWWPAETPFEILVGAILTQNTNWGNVERAIANLKRARWLTPVRMSAGGRERLQELIKPSGYWRQKSDRLVRMAGWVNERCGDDVGLNALSEAEPELLRRDLLAIKGIGPETADSILLYALGKPYFVVDAYTARILGRHGLIPPGIGYGEIQAECEAGLPRDSGLFADFHAQLVYLGKHFCKKSKPRCEDCPLMPLLGYPEDDVC